MKRIVLSHFNDYSQTICSLLPSDYYQTDFVPDNTISHAKTKSELTTLHCKDESTASKYKTTSRFHPVKRNLMRTVTTFTPSPERNMSITNIDKYLLIRSTV